MQAEDQTTNKMKTNKTRVKVAIRVRPMICKQSNMNQNSCVQYLPENKVLIGKDKCFTFDHVFSDKTGQEEVYDKCVKDLILSCFNGYNAAVLAYGQTGSGKTYTMGTGSTDILDWQQAGIVPRVIKQMFTQIQNRKESRRIIAKVSFIQIYNQQIIDLLGANFCQHPEPHKNMKHSLSKDITMPTIRQQKDGSISLVNVVQQIVTDEEQTLRLLNKGGSNRSTSSTLMNDSSSRSHGIFLIKIQQHSREEVEDEGFITANFYFVDLAGSERVKKTGASGMTFKEGININLGLLQLGNVISALSSTQKRDGQFITYRNSKLTRILQDSLGGNSNTYMISCISPAESNYEESLNTIRYATKAMNIKNTPIVNRDPHSAQLNSLKEKIMELENQNRNLRSILTSSGVHVERQSFKLNPRSDILSEELCRIKQKAAQNQVKLQQNQIKIMELNKKANELQINNYSLKRDRDLLKFKVEKLQSNSNNKSYKKIHEVVEDQDQQYGLIQEFHNKIRKLESQLLDQQKMNSILQQQYDKITQQMSKDEQILLNKNKQISKLKSVVKSLKQQNRISEQMSQSLSLRQKNRNNDAQITQSEDQQLSFGQNQELQEAEADYKANSYAHSQKLNRVQSMIREEQEQLHALSEEQINMEYKLISEIKEEYHQKIITLEKQKMAIVKHQQENAGFDKNPKIKQKIDGLQIQLRELRKKAKEQLTLQKQVQLKNEQIKNLSNEIKMQKVQKIEINRKIKQDKSAFEKFKKEKIKQIMATKKDNFCKDKQIKKLTLENKKKSIMIKKKADELLNIKKINEAIKSYNKKNKSKLKKKGLVMNYTQSNDICHNDDEETQTLRLMYQKSIQAILIQQELKIEMDKYDKKIQQLDIQVQKLIDEQAFIQSKIDRSNVMIGYQQKYSNTQQQLGPKLEECQSRIGIIQQNIIFCQKRYNQIGSQLPSFHQQIDIINNVKLNNISKMQTLLLFTYDGIRNFVKNGLLQYEKAQQFNTQNQDLKQRVQNQREQLNRLIIQHHENLQKIRQEMQNRYENYVTQQSNYDHYSQLQGNNGYMNSTSKPQFKLQQKQKRILQKKIFDLNKTNRQLSADVEMWRRKCSVVQQKYHNINMRMAKDKFIGRPRQQQNGVKKNTWNIGSSNINTNAAFMLQQVNQIIDKMDNRRKGQQMSDDEQIMQNNTNCQDIQFNKNKWQCTATLKASRSPILSMTLFQNSIITSGTKAINIWDQQTLQLVADLSSPNYLQGFVKSVIALPNYSALAAACEKQVFIWDIRSYSSINILKYHKDQVRCLYSIGNVLVSAGKGGLAGGSLMFWDLRMIDSQVPYDQKQKNLDVFAMTSYQNCLYYGTRNHQVRRLTLDNRQVLPPFEPPHMDTVTSLATLNSTLLSGSKDKNIKLWNLHENTNNLKCTTHVFNDYVNTIATDQQINLFYAGSRDGQVKIGTANSEGKVRFVGGLFAHTQGVSAICVKEGNCGNGVFLTGSADKTVKIWRPDRDTAGKIGEREE